jgi:hypothetical protein
LLTRSEMAGLSDHGVHHVKRKVPRITLNIFM